MRNIMHTKRDPDKKQDIIWALNPKRQTPIKIVEGLWPSAWSPSGKRWLLKTDNALYVADADGFNIHQVYQDPHYLYLSATWLSDTVLIVNAFSDLSSQPDIYQINIETGEIKQIIIDGLAAAISVAVSNNVWFGVFDGYDGHRIQVLDQAFNMTPVLNNLKVSISPFGFDSVQFLPTTDDFIFIGADKNNDKYVLWHASLSNPSPQELFISNEDGFISDFKISPDGKSVGLIYMSTSFTYFDVVDISSRQLIHKWLYPYSIGTSTIHWSPDSKYIVFPYQSIDIGQAATSADITSGIQIMNIYTGEIDVLLKEDVNIVDWHSLKE
jgi:Tol biopolymer transport system component